MVKVELAKNDIMDLVLLISEKQVSMLSDSYDEVEWEYYFYLNDLADKLVQ
jgi:hypothetical protein